MRNMIKGFISRTVNNPLLFGSFLMLLGSTAGNFFQFLFNLFMSRNLSVADYGTLASLISLIMLPTVFSSALLPTIVSFAATFYAKNQLALVRSLFIMIGKVSLSLGIITIAIFFIFSHYIGSFFHIEDMTLIYLAGLNVFVGYITVLNMALIKAKLAFRFLSFTSFFAAFLKFAFGVSLVLLGYSVTGAMFGMLLASMIGFMITFIPIRSIFTTPVVKSSLRAIDIIRFGGPAALIFFSLTSFITFDIVLVKHFFDPSQAGLYAGLSLIGRVIFFVSAPVNMVLLPLFTQKHTKRELYRNNITISFALILVPSILLTTFYALFPTFVIQFFLKNDEYLQISQYVVPFAILITCYSLVYVLSNIFLSMKKTKIFIPLVLGASIQVTLIWFFHQTFWRIIGISIVIMGILLAGLLLYYWHTSRKYDYEKHE